jgi:peptidoglycan/LPS O-acetylase OafA/YrhL
MGTLRTIFAITVVLGHSLGFVFVGSRNAVQLFYIISGFLISYILIESKSYKSVRAFYINRYLRLYPIYFAVAVLSLIAFFIYQSSTFWEIYKTAPPGADALLMLSNIFLFGQDWVMFSGVENNHLVFSTNFMDSEVFLYQGLLVPQAWTLGVELTFYAIAPFVLPRRKLVYALLALSMALRAYLIFIGLGMKDPWTYRFFPTELAFFLFGALSHQVLLPLYRKLPDNKLKSLSAIATYLLIGFSLSYFLLPAKELYKTIFLFAIFIMLVPLTFLFQNRSRIDKWIGNLSYPIYINHILVISVTTYLLKKVGLDNKIVISIFSVIGSVSFAIFLEKFIGLPFEKIRSKIKLERTA